MEKRKKTYLTFILIILFLVTCFVSLSLLFFATSLNSFSIYREKTPAAEVTISAIKQDEKGPFVNVQITEYKGQSALSSLLFKSNKEPVKSSTSSSYKVYGDVIYIGGAVVDLKDIPLLNFDSTYKIGLLSGKYDIDTKLEASRTDDTNARFDLNGGLSSWKTIYDALQTNSLRSKFYSLFIKNTIISAPGVYSTYEDRTYILYITDQGFVWDLSR